MKKTAKITALCNQKGGVGKSATTLNLGVGLARAGKRVLLTDLDPQGSLTASLASGSPTGWRTRSRTLWGEPFRERHQLPARPLYIMRKE